MEDNTDQQKETILTFLANQLMGEVTFAQVFELTKYQCFNQAEETYKNMSEAEKDSLVQQITKLKEEADANPEQTQEEVKSNLETLTPKVEQDIVL